MVISVYQFHLIWCVQLLVSFRWKSLFSMVLGGYILVGSVYIHFGQSDHKTDWHLQRILKCISNTSPEPTCDWIWLRRKSLMIYMTLYISKWLLYGRANKQINT